MTGLTPMSAAVDLFGAAGEEPLTGHLIRWVFDRDAVYASVECHEPVGANCRLMGAGDCQCEEWTIERDPDGTPFHLCGDERHEFILSGLCNVKEWLEADELVELNGPQEEFLIGRTPIAPQWDGDGYVWAVKR